VKDALDICGIYIRAIAPIPSQTDAEPVRIDGLVSFDDDVVTLT
jgi:hypothetical protein